MENEAQDLVVNINNNNNNNNNNNTKDKEANLLSVHRIRKQKRREVIQGVHHPLEPLSQGSPNGMPTDTTGNVKAERLSPESGTEGGKRVSPTPSSSPKSPASHRTRTPSFAGTPPNPAFTPPTSSLHNPYEGFSPSALGPMGSLTTGHGAVKQMENLITRNCSDLMRSLAAKYNNSNPNDYFSSPSSGPLRTPLSNLSIYKSGPSPFMGIPSPTPGVVNCSREPEKKMGDIPVSTVTAGLPTGIPNPGSPLFPTTGIPGFPSFPLVDMSSTQVLLNMVRNASTNQQTQLEHYLRGAMKRPAEVHTSPLDLSSSVGAKRPRLDSPLVASRSFDVKSLFPSSCDEDKKPQDRTPPPNLITSINSSFKPNLSPPIPLGNAKPNVATLCSERDCPALEAMLQWTVDDVCGFVASIDLCLEYVEAFREQRIDGSALPLLTEEHLTSSIGMKLGPALKLRSTLARKLGACNICLHCTHCHTATSDRRPNSASSGQ